MSYLSTVLLALNLMPEAEAAPAPDDGEAIYQATCAACHGKTGDGDGAAAAALSTKPADLGQSKLPSTDLQKVIDGGGQAIGKSPLMPALGSALTAEQKDKLIKYLISMRG